jgi:transglutaminase-like putative cysteine protease
MPKILKLLFISALFFLSPGQVKAQSLFDTEFTVLYSVDETGESDISQDIKITNKQNDVVATNYSLTIKDMNIFEALGSDETGPIDIETITTDNSTTLKAVFNKQVIGVDRAYNWNLKYKSKDIAAKVGEIWNIHIPKVEILETTKDYNITLVVPETFGPKIFISPKPTNEISEGGNTIYFFNKQTLEQKGITAAFGNYQVLNFKLQYHLGNDSNFTNYQEIALPPDIENKQQVNYTSLKPAPERIYTDADGNLLAVYQVPPKETFEIDLTGAARISGKQIIPEFGGKLGDIPSDLKRKYTKEDTFWEVNSGAIQEIAGSLYDEELTTSQNAQKAYDFVTSNLIYDFDIVGKDFIDRNGALKAVIEPGPWACMEFTDLFVSITRAMGIPSRELNGYAFARESNLTPLSISLKGGDLLHSWAEFYDPIYGWVQVDPTWGTTSGIDYFTKVDTNHFVFSIKGLDSEYPYPAGAYKIDGNEKQVEVDVAQRPDSISFKENFEVYRKTSTNPILTFKNQQKLQIYNESGLRLFNVNNSGKDVLPFSSQIIFASKDSNKLYFEDFNGEGKEVEFTFAQGRAPLITGQTTSLILIVVVALLLCVTVYGLAIHPTALKTLLARLPHRLRDQDQPPNLS